MKNKMGRRMEGGFGIANEEFMISIDGAISVDRILLFI